MRIFWTGKGRSVELDGDTQPLFCRQRNWLGIPTRKQHDGIYFQHKSAGNTMLDRVEPDKSQAGCAVSKKDFRTIPAT